MSDYSYNDIKDSDDFKSFLKSRFGDNFEVTETNQNAVFEAYRYSKGDAAYIRSEGASLEDLNAISEKTFGKNYNELSDDQKVYAGTMQNDEAGHEKENSGNTEADGRQQAHEEGAHRERSLHSDADARYMDLALYGAMQKLKLLDDSEAQKINDAETDADREKKVIETIHNKMQYLSAQKRQDVYDAAYDGILNGTVKMPEGSVDLFEITPPSVLADMYVRNNERIKEKSEQLQKEQKKNPDSKEAGDVSAELNGLVQDRSKIAGRIDSLAVQLARDAHETDDLFFIDVTNAADVYDGYSKMFASRAEALTAESQSLEEESKREGMTAGQQQALQSGRQQIDLKKQIMDQGQQALDEQYGRYLDSWNLNGVAKDNAKDLEKRYDKLEKELQKLELGDEQLGTVVYDNVTLGDLLGRFSFADKDGNAEPQFQNVKGEKLQAYEPGAKIIKGSKLDKAVTLAKQDFLMHHLGSGEEITLESLNDVLTKHLPENMYALYVKTAVQHGIKEDPYQFTDKGKFESFMREVSALKAEKGVYGISDAAFDSYVRGSVNQAYGFRNALAKQLDTDDAKGVVGKVCQPVTHLDVRSQDRVDDKAVSDNIWGSYFKETAQGMLSSALGTARVKGALLVAAGVTQAATGVAMASTMLTASAAIPLALTAKQIWQWRKQQKEAGKPRNFKSFVRDMGPVLGTTALTEAAVACAFIPGAQPLAPILGGAALAVGIGRGAKHDYDKLRKAGKSKVKAGAAALVGATLKAATAFFVNRGMQSLANNFMHTTETVKGQEEKSHMEWRENADLADKAHETLEHFYKGSPDALNHDLQEVKAELDRLGVKNVSPEVFLRDAVDSGMNTGVNTANHIDGGGVHFTHGNNTVLTEKWCETHGVDYDNVKAVGDIRGEDGHIHISADVVKAHAEFAREISVINEVGHVEGSQAHHDGVLHRNASVNGDGVTVHDDKNPDRYDTYADHNNSGYHQEKVIDQKAVPDKLIQHNLDTPDAVGMYGVRNGWLRKIIKGPGSLLDKILHNGGSKQRQPEDKSPLPPQDNKGQNQGDNKQKLLNDGKLQQEDGTQKTHSTDQPQKGGDAKPVCALKPQSAAQAKQKVEPELVTLLKDELEMLSAYRVKISENEYKDYYKRVEKEAAASGKDMVSFLKERREKLEKVVKEALPAYVKSDAALNDLSADYHGLVLQGKAKDLKAASLEKKIYDDFAGKNKQIGHTVAGINKQVDSPLSSAIRKHFWEMKSNDGAFGKEGKDPKDFNQFIKAAGDYFDKSNNKSDTLRQSQRSGRSVPAASNTGAGRDC